MRKKRKEKKLKEILQQQKGASLIFVLCIMLLLMAVSGSLLAASSTAAGTSARYKEQQQLQIFAQSTMQVLAKAIKQPPALGQAISPPKSIGQAVLKNLYDAEKNHTALEATITAQLGQDSPLLPGMIIKNGANEMDITFPQQQVTILPSQPAVSPSYDEEGAMISPGSPYVPEKTTISCTLTVTLTLEYGQSKLIATAIYSYANGYLEDGVFLQTGTWKEDSYAIKLPTTT